MYAYNDRTLQTSGEAIDVVWDPSLPYSRRWRPWRSI